MANHTCPYCGKSFGDPCNYNNHVITHTGDRPFKCRHPGCDYAANQKGNLRTHIRAIHTNVKPFECPNCPYRTARQSDLAKHIRTQHNKINQSYLCRICAQKFNSKDYFYQHERRYKDTGTWRCLECASNFHTEKKLSWHKCPSSQRELKLTQPSVVATPITHEEAQHFNRYGQPPHHIQQPYPYPSGHPQEFNYLPQQSTSIGLPHYGQSLRPQGLNNDFPHPQNIQPAYYYHPSSLQSEHPPFAGHLSRHLLREHHTRSTQNENVAYAIAAPKSNLPASSQAASGPSRAPPRKDRGHPSKLTAIQAQEIVHLIRTGQGTATDAAKLYNVHQTTVSQLLAHTSRTAYVQQPTQRQHVSAPAFNTQPLQQPQNSHDSRPRQKSLLPSFQEVFGEK